MTDEQFTSSRRATDGLDRYSVIAVSFEDDRKADDALTLLRELDSRQQVAVEEAVVVVHQEDGQVIEKGRIESKFLPGTTGGGLLGLLIGIVGGPFGMLIGAAGGLLAGSVFDVHDRDDDESMLGAISSSVRAGRTALLAVVTEESPEVIDAAMAAKDQASRRPEHSCGQRGQRFHHQPIARSTIAASSTRGPESGLPPVPAGWIIRQCGQRKLGPVRDGARAVLLIAGIDARGEAARRACLMSILRRERRPEVDLVVGTEELCQAFSSRSGRVRGRQRE